MVPNRKVTFVLPYLGKLLLDLRTTLRRTIEGPLPYCKLEVSFKSRCRVNTPIRINNSIDEKICSWIIYRYTCSNCKITYSGETFHHFHHFQHTIAAKHMGISNLIEKRLKNVSQSAISDHLLQHNCAINFDDFRILAADSNKFKLLLNVSSLKK